MREIDWPYNAKCRGSVVFIGIAASKGAH